MAIDDAAEGAGGDSSPGDEGPDGPDSDSAARVGEYSWEDYFEEFATDVSLGDLTVSSGEGKTGDDGSRGDDAGDEEIDWERAPFDPENEFGFHPDRLSDRFLAGATGGHALQRLFDSFLDPETTPVRKGDYLWEHYKQEYYYLPDGSRPRDEDGNIEPFERSAHLGFDPESLPNRLSEGENLASALEDIVDERTVDVHPDIDEDAFFTTFEGDSTVVSRYDLEKAVSLPKKRHFREIERYWVNKPYAFVIIFHSEKENEKKYYVIEPHLTPIERELEEFLTEKLRMAIKYAESDVAVEGSESERRDVVERETLKLLRRYDLYTEPSTGEQGSFGALIEGIESIGGSYGEAVVSSLESVGISTPSTREESDSLEGMAVRPEPVLVEEDDDTLSEFQVEKLLYALKRDFIGYERIDAIKHDINVEDISVDGYDSPVFVYHTDYEQIITNVEHGTQQLDDFVVKLAQRSGKGISKRQPQVDATLPDGSRAQLTLGQEVSAHGTNYTIRQFKEIPFTPVDLINWKTFSLREMAFLWLCIENEKSLMFAGGTASGKTTSLNAVSLFIPSNTKIVSIEDTREVELPQRNWIASVTRPSFGEDERGDIDEFDLLEAALRQRPDYIVMGEVRGEEGRTLFQVMSTGHTTYTTFHADNVSEVIKRFTTDPINVSKTLFTALDLISIQTSTRVRGQKVRRSRELTEIRRYDPENDEINVNDIFQWRPETDSYRHSTESTTLEEIQFDRGWSDGELERQMDQREAILAYLIEHGLNSYAEVAATIQAYINDPPTILTLVANDELEAALADLRQMESVLIDVDEAKEEMVPRPDPDAETRSAARDVLEAAEETIFDEYRGADAPNISEVLDLERDEADVELREPQDDEDTDVETGDDGDTDIEARDDEDPDIEGRDDGDPDIETRDGGDTDVETGDDGDADIEAKDDEDPDIETSQESTASDTDGHPPDDSDTDESSTTGEDFRWEETEE